MANDYSINAVFKVDTTEFDKGIKKVGKSVSGVSDSISTMGKALGKAFAITSFAVVAKKIGDISKEFSKATSNIAKGTGATGKALEELSKSVNNAMLNGVGRSADEVGGMVANLNTRLGVTGDTLETLVDKFDQFSTVNNTEVQSAINTTADIMMKWNVSTEKAGSLLDQLTVASQNSGATVDELSLALKNGQSIFSQFGMSLTESLAFLSSLKKNGIETSVALTGMRTALANFSKDGKDAEKAFAEVSDKIKNASTNAEALQIAVETFGSRSGAEMLKVLQAGGEGVEAFTLALENAGGALAKTDEASRTSQDALEDLQATLKATFFTGGGDTQLRDTIDSIASALRTIDFSGLKESFTTLGSFIQGSWEQFKQFFTLLGTNIDTVSGYFQSFADNVYAHFNSLYQNMQTFVVGFRALMNGDWQTVWDTGKLIVLRTIKLIVDAINDAIASMPNLFNSVINGYNKILETQDKLLLEVFHLPEKYFKSVKLPTYKGEDLIDTKDIEATIKDVATKIENRTGETVTYTLKELEQVKSSSKTTSKAIVGNIGDIGQSAEEAGEKAKEALDPTTTDIIKGWEDTFKAIENDAKDWSDTIGTVKTGIDTIANEAFSALGESLVTGEAGWKDFGSTALGVLANILQGLSAQLSALAAVNIGTKQYATAIKLASASAVALVASGAMTALANSSSSVSDNLADGVSSLEEFRDILAEIGSGTSSVYELLQDKKEYEDLISDLQEQMSEIVELEKNEKNLSTRIGYWFDMVTLGQEIQETIDKLNSVYSDFNDELEDGIDLNNEYIASFKTFYSALSDSTSVFSDIVKNLHLTEISNELLDIYDDLTKAGLTIGETLVDSIIEGASREDFLSEMKDYLKENIVKLAVYTDTFNARLADIGSRMAQAIVQGTDLTSIKTELEALYDEASANAEIALASLEEVFGSTSTATEELNDDLTELQETLADLIEGLTSGDVSTSIVSNLTLTITSAYEELEKTGSTLGETLVNSIVSGAEKSDFLSDMKEYLTEQVIALTIYTDEFNERLAEVGEKMAQAIAEGADLTSIRTELEALWDEATELSSTATAMLEDVFGDLAEEVEETTEVVITATEEIEEELTSLEIAIESFKESMSDLGGDIANNLIYGLSEGLTNSDFLETMYSYIRKLIVQTVVYTESMQSEIEAIGQSISKGLSEGFSTDSLATIRQDLSNIFYSASKQMTAIDSLLEDVFGDFSEEVEETVETVTTATEEIEEELTSLERAIESFKESVSDLGGDIASNLISGLADGLTNSDFLDTMYSWIRKLVVQTVVYTESMKAEIEAIGQAIADGLESGFTDTSLHNIRRDLSYIFYSASKQMEGIDTVLESVFSGYATGTQSATRGLHLVGEAGPELVAFKGGETVYNAGQTRTMLGNASAGSSFNVTFNNTSDTSAYTMMKQLRQYDRELKLNGVI